MVMTARCTVGEDRFAAVVLIDIGLRFAVAVHGSRRLVFGPDISAIDGKAAVRSRC